MLSRIGSGLLFIWAAVVFLIGLLLVLPFILITSATATHQTSLRFNFIFLKGWAKMFCVFSGIRIITKQKSVPDDNACIYVCNHCSYLDSVALVRALPAFKPLGKIEMGKVPLFGLIYRRIVVMIDRTDKESRARSVEELRKELGRGTSILIFPEGTINRTEESLTGFYDGAFRLALETATPIRPVILLDAADLMPPSDPMAFRPGTITCLIDDVVDMNEYSSHDVQRLKSVVYERMKGMVENRSL